MAKLTTILGERIMRLLEKNVETVPNRYRCIFRMSLWTYRKKEILYRKNLVNIVFYDKINDRIKALVFVSPVVSQIRKEIRLEKMKSN